MQPDVRSGKPLIQGHPDHCLAPWASSVGGTARVALSGLGAHEGRPYTLDLGPKLKQVHPWSQFVLILSKGHVLSRRPLRFDKLTTNGLDPLYSEQSQ